MTIGEAIKAARDTRNITIKNFADQMGIPEATLTKWEKGQRKPSEDQQIQIFEKLNMSLKWDPESEYSIVPKEDINESVDDIKAAVDDDNTENEEDEEPDDEDADNIIPGKIQGFGACAFCGQSMLIEADHVYPKHVLNIYATRHCKCEAAKAAERRQKEKEEKERDRQRRIDNAIFDIGNLIGDAGMHQVAQIMQTAVPQMVDDAFEKMSIRIDSQTIVSMQITSQGKIRVERRVTNIDTSESE